MCGSRSCGRSDHQGVVYVSLKNAEDDVPFAVEFRGGGPEVFAAARELTADRSSGTPSRELSPRTPSAATRFRRGGRRIYARVRQWLTEARGRVSARMWAEGAGDGSSAAAGWLLEERATLEAALRTY